MFPVSSLYGLGRKVFPEKVRKFRTFLRGRSPDFTFDAEAPRFKGGKCTVITRHILRSQLLAFWWWCISHDIRANASDLRAVEGDAPPRAEWALILLQS